MYTLVLLRHGESTWNLENRFTGWTDVDLSPKGLEEAKAAGRLLKQDGFDFDVAHTSLLRRAIRTLWITLEGLDRMWIPVRKSWRLNERHYGALQGLNKAETAKKFGDEQVKIWRRSYATPPPPLTPDDERHPGRDPRYASLPKDLLPLTESLETTVARFLPYWHDQIVPDVLGGSPRADRRPRQQPARARQAPRRRFRGRHRLAQHPDRDPARVRARQGPEADPQPLPRRSRGGEEGGRGRRQPVEGGSLRRT